MHGSGLRLIQLIKNLLFVNVVRESQGGGVTKDNYGTSGLLLHIKNNHKEALDKYKHEQEIKQLATPPVATVNNYFQTMTRKSNANKPSYPSSKANHPIKCNLSQPTLFNLFEKKQLWNINHPKAMECHKFVGQYLALNFTSFRTVETEGFRQMINFMMPQYKIPSRFYFSKKNNTCYVLQFKT